ncbi:hypothetical protein DICPUDRAFT_81747 [Dictyostelium purpureum]|uniref:IPT/TIG domain-containing protein n=1 Tax=Dictyostelium purpureum TaxID=5786 RepID=F0ZUG3_DICPU|nr:uncharacterized protein DICPUDRAFT_81747 [Dictyostelium purpureum]EGC32417.1 hypothetical protein DICPUDRAFT_81747 [Dictyostelium purpureum]|eukprot:XP_003291064.1 hypothetical protein DICPUDRAFT_81747 [Dictyostelium purpureum]
MKFSLFITIVLLFTLYISNTSAQSPSISSITSVYRNESQLVTVTGTGFTVGTNLTLKNTFTMYGVSLLCPQTVYVNSTKMTCVVPQIWASDYTSIYLNNSYTSRYLTVISAKIAYMNITSTDSIYVNGDGFLTNSTFDLQLYNNTKVRLTCYSDVDYKSVNCEVPFDGLLTDCFKVNYADSFYSASVNFYLPPTFRSVELLGNALKMEVDSHCPSNTPSYSFNINSIPFSSVVKAEPYLFFEPSFTLCTDFSKKFNMSLTSSFYTFGSTKLESNVIFFDCEKGKAFMDNSEVDPLPTDSSDHSSSSSSSSLFNTINFTIILILSIIYLF